MFVDENQFTAAFNSAEFEVARLISDGVLVVSDGMSIKTVATRIATAAIRGGSQADTNPWDDIGSVPGVQVQRVCQPTWYPATVAVGSQA